MSERKDGLTGHRYDNIEEYDNPTPGWWTWIFVVTVVFGGLYFLFVNIVADGELSPVASLQAQETEYIRKQFGELVNEKPDAATLVRLMNTEKWQKAGAYTFGANCAACHGREANGVPGPGPNLTDDYYINVQKIEDIYDVIQKGRNNGAMPTWGNRLSALEMLVAAAYVASLRGKNLTGKAVEPSAKLAPPWPAYTPTTKPVEK